MDETIGLKKQKSVSDLYYISALSAYDVRALRIDRSNPNRQQFIFDNETPISVLVYENGEVLRKELTVEQIEPYFLIGSLLLPGKYPKVLKDVRATIHGYREDNY